MSHDVVIVGGGFAGLAAATQLARAGRDLVVIDAGAPRNRFAAHSHGILGHDGKPPLQLLSEAAAQLLAYPTAAIRRGQAIAAGGERDAFRVTLADGETLAARRLILTGGVSDRMPDIPGLAERWGESVLHCPYCHGFEVRGGPLGVLASHPMSAHQAQLIADWGPTTLFETEGFRADAEQRARLAACGVAIESSAIVALAGPGQSLAAVRLADGRSLSLRALFVAPRQHQASPLAEQLGCLFEGGPMGPIVKVDAMKLTSTPGVYSAGDAARAMQNASFALADGVMAGVAAHQSLVFDS